MADRSLSYKPYLIHNLECFKCCVAAKKGLSSPLSPVRSTGRRILGFLVVKGSNNCLIPSCLYFYC